MLALVKLTRPVNLLIVAATMILMRHGVIEGNLMRGLQGLLDHLGNRADRNEIELPEWFGPQMPVLLFALLVISTMLIAAGGNVINDYFDTRIDRINKPGEVIVGRKVKRRVAMSAHLVLSAIGILLGAFVALRSGMIQLAVIPVFAVAALWTYSTILKKQLLIGNLLVAVLTALVPLTVGLYEIPMMQRTFAQPRILPIGGEEIQVMPVFNELWYWISAFAAFAFLGTLVRELQKDMADVRGDLAGACRTVPIAWGMQWSKAIVLFYIGILVAGIFFVNVLLLQSRIINWYLSLAVIGPLLISAGFTYHARSRHEHIMAGQLMKVAMVTAILFSLLIPHLP